MQIICIFDKQSAKLNEGAGENMEIYLHYTRILLQINDLDVSDVQTLDCYSWYLALNYIDNSFENTHRWNIIWKMWQNTFINIVIFSAIGSIVNFFTIRASLKKEK